MASNKKMSSFDTAVGLLETYFVVMLSIGPTGFDNIKITFKNFNDSVNLLNGMTDAIYDQLENIGVQTISGIQWGHLSVADQDVGTSHDVTFASVDTDLVDGSAAATQTPGDNSTKVATTAYVDAAVPAGLLWSRTIGATNYLLPDTALDDVGSTVFRISKGWFSNLEITDMPTVGGTSINSSGVLFLTSAEVTQLANIDTTTISISQWGNVGAMDQDVATTDDVTFLSVTAAGGDVVSSVSATDGTLTIENASAVEVVKLDANGLSFLRGGNLEISGDFIQQVHTDNVSNPPTDAELDSALGLPATVGAGFTAYIDDNGAGTNFYQCISDGTNWWTFAGTKAV